VLLLLHSDIAVNHRHDAVAELQSKQAGQDLDHEAMDVAPYFLMYDRLDRLAVYKHALRIYMVISTYSLKMA
jgi:hypothetical protein